MFIRRKTSVPSPLAFEESLGEAWTGHAEQVEMPLHDKPFFYLGSVAFALVSIVAFRLVIFALGDGEAFRTRAFANANRLERIAAPRGIIYDRHGKPLVENMPAFVATLDPRPFLTNAELQEQTLIAADEILGIPRERVWEILRENESRQFVEPIVLKSGLSQSELIKLTSISISTFSVVQTFERHYLDGPVFSSVVGYVGLVGKDDLVRDPSLARQDVVGKTGLELQYDAALRGRPGVRIELKNSKGATLEEQQETAPQIGAPLTLTVDAELQIYFYERFLAGLRTLGRERGVGIALDPRNGEVLSLISFPAYDNNIFSAGGRSEERRALLTSPTLPLFNRAVGGLYAPGSTIKPFVGIAALKEGVIGPERQIYSPGYLDVPNPYDPVHPTRFPDWRPQGWVDLSSAIAQSSNVYFFLVGGGSPKPTLLEGQGGITGLGITGLREWWNTFRFDALTGIDLPSEAQGSLPDPGDIERESGRPWLLGDTYNVSIGQGSLLVTPISLISAIGAIGNGGIMYQPRLSRVESSSVVLADFPQFLPELREVQKGMRETVTSPLGTAFLMNDLPFWVSGKTGSAQIGGKQENAFFVGYAGSSSDDAPAIAVLVLVENALQGSLNAVPIAKDVLSWYYENRIK